MNWRLRDIIDLEYFLHKDEVSHAAGDQQYLHERDRNIFLQSVMPGEKEGKSPDRHVIVRTWLERRRAAEAAAVDVLPGEGVESLYGSLRVLFFIAGLLLGGGLGASYLAYTGDSPVNVFVYLAVFVFSQLLLLLMLLLVSAYRLSAGSLLSASPLYMLISRLMLKILMAARSRISRKMTAEQRDQAEFTLGAVIGKTRTHGFLFFLPVFIVTQLAGIGFNLGLLAATLFKVVTADLAFGWQSTIQLSPEAVHSLVGKIALPWAWAVPEGISFPSLAQIEGSRIILKEGIYDLATPDLVSWWPFLCFAVLVYGLLPRLLLFLWAIIVQHSRLASLDFRQARYEQLLQRMTTPLVSTHSRAVDDADAGEREASAVQPAILSSGAGGGRAGRSLLVMIPDEIFDSCSRQELESVVNRGAAHEILEIIPIRQDYDSHRQMLADLAARTWPAGTDILIIQEAWQPPILEYIDFIRQLRRAIGDTPCIRIGLIGKPRPGTILTPVKEENRRIWVRKISALGDPCIFSGELVANAT